MLVTLGKHAHPEPAPRLCGFHGACSLGAGSRVTCKVCVSAAWYTEAQQGLPSLGSKAAGMSCCGCAVDRYLLLSQLTAPTMGLPNPFAAQEQLCFSLAPGVNSPHVRDSLHGTPVLIHADVTTCCQLTWLRGRRFCQIPVPQCW